MGLVRARHHGKNRLFQEKFFFYSRKNISLNGRTPNDTLHIEPFQRSRQNKKYIQICISLFFYT